MTTLTHLSTQEVASGGASSVTFGSISGSYQHLMMRWSARSEAGGTYDYLEVQFNSDTSTNYYYWRIYQIAGYSSPGSSQAGSQNEFKDFMPINKQNTVGWSGGEIWIIGYTNSQAGTVLTGMSGNNAWSTGSAAMNTAQGAGIWVGTTADVSTITLKQDSGSDFEEHSKFTLYGVSGTPVT